MEKAARLESGGLSFCRAGRGTFRAVARKTSLRQAYFFATRADSGLTAFMRA